ncbi:MAG: glycosyltransferase family 4 protein [Pontixanthobacter sp.]
MSKTASGSPSFLHLHSTFAAGGKEIRCVQLINAFGKNVRHSIVSAVPERMEAAKLISSTVPVNYPKKFPSLKGFPSFGRLHSIAKVMAKYDLVLTYNWGAMDAVMAHTLFSEKLRLPPLIHHEDGFNEDEQTRLKPMRNLYRRIALGRSSGLIVPSEQLEEIALETWQQPMGRVKRISNGINVRAFAGQPKPDALPGIVKLQGERWVGMLAGLRRVKNIPRLVRAFAGLPDNWNLIIVGEGPEEYAIRAEADRLGLANRVVLAGFAAKPERFVGLFDIFALSSDTEQFPISVVEAMASARPVVAPAVGDISEMVAAPNQPFIGPAGDEQALANALQMLAADDKLRSEIGEANRVKALAEFDEKVMISAYRRAYFTAMGRPEPKLFGEFKI